MTEIVRAFGEGKAQHWSPYGDYNEIYQFLPGGSEHETIKMGVNSMKHARTKSEVRSEFPPTAKAEKTDDSKLRIGEDWTEASMRLPDVFQQPVIAPQGQNGVAHFNYYDPERLLSFQWDGMFGQHVTVSHGGYGEPVKWTFDFIKTYNLMFEAGYIRGEIREPAVSEHRPFFDAALHFKQICDLWIDNMES